MMEQHDVLYTIKIKTSPHGPYVMGYIRNTKTQLKPSESVKTNNRLNCVIYQTPCLYFYVDYMLKLAYMKTEL